MTLKELIDTYGLKDIHTRTRISNDSLLNLLNEDYASMSKTNALGFIKILEREYGVELSELRQSVVESIEDENYIPKDLVLTERRYGSKKKIASSVVLFLLLFAGLVYVVYLINAQNADSHSDVIHMQESLPIIENEALEFVKQEPQSKEVATDDFNEVDENRKDEGITKSEDVAANEVQTDENVIEKGASEEVVELEVEQVAKEDGLEAEQTKEAKVLERVAVDEVVIIPNQKLWLGYINLDTNERVQKNNANKTRIVSNNTIIITGHGRMQVAQKQYNSGDRLYFHFIDGELRRLSESAFRELNGGRIW